VAFRLRAGKGVSTVNVINLDNDLQSDAPRAGEVRGTEVVLSRQLRAILHANGHSACSEWHIPIW
jgi:hypothetical protein